MPKKDVGDKEDGDKSDREALECIALNAFDRIIVGGLSLGSSVTFLVCPQISPIPTSLEQLVPFLQWIISMHNLIF
jgi:hypothetical protein